MPPDIHVMSSRPLEKLLGGGIGAGENISGIVTIELVFQAMIAGRLTQGGVICKRGLVIELWGHRTRNQPKRWKEHPVTWMAIREHFKEGGEQWGQMPLAEQTR